MDRLEQIKTVFRKIFKSEYGFSGDYTSWEEASVKCIGYNADNILEKVKKAILKVKNGEAEYERDSVLFDHIEYSWPLLSVLMWVAAINNGKLNVLDFGGSLGTSYFQNRKFLAKINSVKWNIVEQENFVTYGNKHIANDYLKFYYSFNELISKDGLPDLLLINCTLPYLPHPYETLNDLLNLGIPNILIDNTFYNYENRNRIAVQKVPPTIYDASYPCWFLNFEEVKKKVSEHYQIIEIPENDSEIFLDGKRIRYKGILARLKENNESD